MSYSELQCVTVSYIVLQSVTVSYIELQGVTVCYSELQCVTLCYTVLHCVTVSTPPVLGRDVSQLLQLPLLVDSSRLPPFVIRAVNHVKNLPKVKVQSL